MPKTFHVVKLLRNGTFQSYSIYANNEPYLVPGEDARIGKREAYAIAHLLNEGPWTR